MHFKTLYWEGGLQQMLEVPLRRSPRPICALPLASNCQCLHLWAWELAIHQLCRAALLGAHTAGCKRQGINTQEQVRDYPSSLPFRWEKAEKWFCTPHPKIAWKIKIQLSTLLAAFPFPFLAGGLLQLPNKLLPFEICFWKNPKRGQQVAKGAYGQKNTIVNKPCKV